jgi:hypothetical protein
VQAGRVCGLGCRQCMQGLDPTCFLDAEGEGYTEGQELFVTDR